jgi:thioredoxin 1
MTERLQMLVLAFGVVAAVWLFWQIWQRRRLGQLQQTQLPTGLARQIAPGAPAVLYFTSDGCVQCKLQQTPVLEQFAADTGIAVHKVDAVAQADLADFYGVMTLPTTVVLDRQRRPVAINYGLTQLSKLRQQIAAVA